MLKSKLRLTMNNEAVLHFSVYEETKVKSNQVTGSGNDAL